ncbi:MAG: hypothetical protein OQK05_14600 [Pseudopelagicola sp.]|nr:hypothetical protein [Pseudopelagicola sp.]
MTTRRTKRRAGYTKIPNTLFQVVMLPGNPPRAITTDEKFLLIYFASQSSEWANRRDFILEQLGWGEEKYDRVRKRLVEHGILATEQVYKNGKRAGTKVSVNWQFLNPENQGLEKPLHPENQGPENQGDISRTTFKGRSTSDVVDDDDRF